MITLTIIITVIVFVWAIAKSSFADKKSCKQQAIDEERTANLLDMAFYDISCSIVDDRLVA